MINLRTTLEKIAPELERRLEKSHLHDWTGDVLIKMPDRRAVLSVTSGRVAVVETKQTEHTVEGGQEIAQLILGCKDPRETVEETGIGLGGDAEELVEVLFPWQHPMMGDEAV